MVPHCRGSTCPWKPPVKLHLLFDLIFHEFAVPSTYSSLLNDWSRLGSWRMECGLFEVIGCEWTARSGKVGVAMGLI